VQVGRGETLAVVGRTGCGKTTLMNLLVRLWEPDRPEMIRLDGRPLREIPLSVLHRDIAFVPQDSFLFSDTIENNIAFGVEAAEADSVSRAARLADVHDNIAEFQQGYATVLGERGVTVSGGQKQRISIARVFLKDPPILILDEATSSLDNDSEYAVAQSLKSLANGRTTLTIAHRLSSIVHSDRILVLTKDGIVEEGTHETLLAQKGVYYGFYTRTSEIQ
jgi:ATP-binding cassette subfamily B protein